MLVLKRRPGESVHIGEDIVITVLAVEGDRVKIGFEAPRTLTIIRAELETIGAENAAAAKPSGIDIDSLLQSEHRPAPGRTAEPKTSTTSTPPTAKDS